MYCTKSSSVSPMQSSPHFFSPDRITSHRHSVASIIVSIFCALTSLTGFHSVTLAQTPVADGIIGNALWSTTQPESAIRSAANSSGCGGGAYDSSNLELEGQVVQLVNQLRLEHGLLPLKRVPQLDASSRFHATDMSVDDYFSHTSYDRVDGTLVESCEWIKRLQSYYENWGTIAENIAAGYQMPESVVKAWMDSEGHRANILASGNWEIGVGYFLGGGKYTHYWVQDFGRRNNVYPIVLDAEAATTATGSVTVHTYGNWQEIRLRTDDQDWSDWMPFQSAMHWQIQGDAGEHTVYAEMRSDTQTSTSSDTIVLTQSNRSIHFANLPDELTFIYSESENQLLPEAHTLRPIVELANGYTWQAVVNDSWLSLSPETGKDLDSIEMRPTVSRSSGVTPGTATVVLSLVDAKGAVIDNHSISISLQVLATPLNDIFIPTVMR